MTTTVERRLARVLLIEPNPALRSALVTLLDAERYEVEVCVSLEQLLQREEEQHAPVIALVAWQSMEGLLSEENRDSLVDLTRRVRVVLMVPRRWMRLLDRTDIGSVVAACVAKPFEADELLTTLEQALLIPADA